MERETNIILLSIFCLLLVPTVLFSQNVPNKSEEWITIFEDTCIYDNNNHAAFTSLVEWKGVLYVAFREAGSHNGTSTDKGHIKVLSKENGRWKTNHDFSVDGLDMRDPCFVKWNNRLLLFTSYRYSELTDNGWTDLHEIHHNAPHPLYIWKIRPYKDELYGIGHRGNEWPILMKTRDGLNWEVVNEYKIGGNSTEADLLFINNRLYICFRVEIPEGSYSKWGESKYPFTNTKWTEMDISIASPEMISATNKIILLSGREFIFDKATRSLKRMVTLFAIDKNGMVKGRKVINTESGDQGYGSIIQLSKNEYMMSYYSGTNKTKVRTISFSIDEGKL